MFSVRSIISAFGAGLLLGLHADVVAEPIPTAPTSQQLFDPHAYGASPGASNNHAPARPRTPSDALTLLRAVQRALADNPRLAIAGREIGMAAGKKIQAATIPNPEISFELDDAFGTGDFAGLRSAETKLAFSQLIEFPGKRRARAAAGSAELESAHWQYTALRLEIMSDTAVAFFNVLSGQRKVQVYDSQVASLSRLIPLLQRRIEAGASSPAEIARTEVAADLVRAERERARTALAIARRELAVLMGSDRIDFGYVTGEFGQVARPPPFAVVLRSLDSHPQLVRWSAVRAQRDAELLSARLKPLPDLKIELGLKQIRETTELGRRTEHAFKLGASIPIPVWDQNLGGITEAGEARAKVEAERAAGKAALVLTLAKAYDTLNGALRELDILRGSTLPKARQAADTIESGYSQGRFTLLEVFDVQNTVTQTSLREIEALTSVHTSLATIEGLTGTPLGMTRRLK
jgi:cobalt-zinc-cadmium efflux system outer membrane protein